MTNMEISTELGEHEIEEEDIGSGLVHPYDPSKIRIRTKQPTIQQIVSRLEHKEIMLTPDFQRQGGIWSDRNQSRLVESILLGIPLPAFYFDATDVDRWVVVDGLQRLTALARFMLGDEDLERLKLTRLNLVDLEFLELEGRSRDDLGRSNVRRIRETQITAYLIEEGTPDELKFNVFKRINTGGLPLSAQEIRHALNQGPAATLLKRLVDSDEFKSATSNGISGKRMSDRECALRFLAFARAGVDSYRSSDFDLFLSQEMANLNGLDRAELEELAARFKRAMDAARRIFGDDAFRKRYDLSASRKPINKALFEAWAVNLDALSDEELVRLAKRRKGVKHGFIGLMHNSDFERSISQGTGDRLKVRTRFRQIARLCADVLS